MSLDQNAMVDYARLYDMSQLEINLFYRKDEEELIGMIENAFSEEIRRIRSRLITIRKRKTEIKTLKQMLESPIEYFENLNDNIYTESETNIKSLKITMKKVKSILNSLDKTQQNLKDPEKIDTPIERVFDDQIGFLRSRLLYYDSAMEKYQSFIEYSKANKTLKKKSAEDFEKRAKEYCVNLLSSVDIEENMLKTEEESCKQELEKWRNGLVEFQEQYEEQIIKSLEKQ